MLTHGFISIYSKPLAVLLGVVWGFAHAEELTTDATEQQALNITVYNTNIALIKDRRQVNLPQGRQTLAFKDVSAAIIPETAILTADKVALIEQNFEYDLLSPKTLLNKYVGKDVGVVIRNKDERLEKRATVLANNDGGVILKIDDKIMERDYTMTLVYDDVPQNLRDKPTMTMQLLAEQAGEQSLELTYLSKQLNWKADYIASLTDDNRLDLTGWVTLTNNSGTDYPNAKLQLVAGELNRVANDLDLSYEKGVQKRAMRAVAAPKMEEESLFEYHLYSLAFPVSIKNKQQKQVSLLSAAEVPYKKQLHINARDSFGWRSWGKNSEYQDLSVDVKVIIDNNKAHNLGLPIPAGVVRTYQNDSSGSMQFIGEDRIKHTPDNETISLQLGKAFDVTAKRKQTAFSQQRKASKNAVSTVKSNVITASYQVVLKNAKDHDVTVDYRENFFGDWKIIKQSFSSEKLNSNLNRWYISIPAKGESTLTYTVQMEY